MTDHQALNIRNSDFSAFLELWGRHFEMLEPDPHAFLRWVSQQLNPLPANEVGRRTDPLMAQLLERFSASVGGAGLTQVSLQCAFMAWIAQNVADLPVSNGTQATVPQPEHQVYLWELLNKGCESDPALACHWDIQPAEGRQWQVPRQIGPFLIEEVVGSGGMGIIFKGKRQNECNQVAAVKVLQLMHERSLAAFKKEMELLSSLQHPNIAHYLDHGMLSSQRPWLALEYVKGVPVDEWCHREKPSIKRLLRVFLKICETVTFAHNNLIIHRDLKPSNILIQADDEPKLLDFGIAAVLDPDTQAQETLTGLHLHAMTPDYASPEQIQHKRLTAATDVYSLGVILYQMLTGRQPYKLETQSPVEWINRLERVRVLKPSRKLAEVSELGRLARNPICGDLDAICLKAMAPQAAERYENAAALAADVARVIGGYPVLARNNTMVYRFAKYLRRHQFQVLWATALFAVLGFSTVWSVRQSHEISKERDLAAVERDRAEKTARFLISMFEEIDPDLNASRHAEISAYDILENGRREMLEGQIDDPQTRAKLLLTMGEVYRSLGKYTRSHELLKEALALPLEKGVVTFELAMSFIKTLEAQGYLPAARERLEVLSQGWVGTEDHRILAKLDYARGRIAHGMGQYQPANRFYLKALAVDVGSAPEIKLGLLVDRAHLLAKMNYHTESIQAFQEVLQLEAQLIGDKHSLLIKTLFGLGEQYRALAMYDKAEAAYASATTMIESHSGKEHPFIITARMGQAKLNSDAGKFEEAMRGFSEIKPLAEKLLGDDHPVHGEILKEMSLLYGRMGQWQEAERLLRESYSHLVGQFGMEHPMIVDALAIWAGLYYSKADFEKSIEMYKRALALQSKISDDTDNPKRMEILLGLAKNYRDRRDYHQAEEITHELIATNTRIYGAKHPDSIECMFILAEIFRVQRKYGEAEDLAREGLVFAREVYGEDHEKVISWTSILAELHSAKGDLKVAKALYQKVVNNLSNRFGSDHFKVNEKRFGLARVLVQLKEWDAAEEAIQTVLAGNIEEFGYLHLYTASAYRSLAILMKNKGDMDVAENHFLEMIAICGQIDELDLEPCHTWLTNYGVFLSSQKGDHLGAATVYAEAFRADSGKYQTASIGRSVSHYNFGTFFLRAGLFFAATEQFYRAYYDRVQLLGPDHLRTIQSQEMLAQGLYYVGDLEGATWLICRALDFRAEQTPVSGQDVALGTHLLGRIQFAKSALTDAKAHYEHALNQLQALYEPPAHQLLNLWCDLAQLALVEGDHEGARVWLDRAFQNTEGGSLERARVQILMAQDALDGGHVAAAKRLLDESLPVVVAAQNPIPLADWCHQEARRLLTLDQPGAALEKMQQSLVLLQDRFGESHPRLLLVMSALAEVLGEAGELQEALRLTERIQRLSQDSNGEDEIFRHVAQSVQGSLLARLGRQSKAKLLLRDAHQDLLARLGPNHYFTRAAYARQDATSYKRVDLR